MFLVVTIKAVILSKIVEEIKHEPRLQVTDSLLCVMLMHLTCDHAFLTLSLACFLVFPIFFSYTMCVYIVNFCNKVLRILKFPLVLKLVFQLYS